MAGFTSYVDIHFMGDGKDCKTKKQTEMSIKYVACVLGAALVFILGYYLGYGVLDQEVYNRYNAYIEEISEKDSTIQPVKIESWESHRKYNQEYSIYKEYRPGKGSDLIFHYMVDKYGKEHFLVSNHKGGIIELNLEQK